MEATWGVYQAMVAAYRDADRTSGKTKMQKLIDTLSAGVPAALVEVRTLGRTLKQRAADVLVTPSNARSRLTFDWIELTPVIRTGAPFATRHANHTVVAFLHVTRAVSEVLDAGKV